MEPTVKNDGLVRSANPHAIGESIYSMIAELFPICRSITGNGLRQTLRAIQAQIPLELFEVPTGSQVFDWTVPKEWNILDAYVKNSVGERVIDFRKSNQKPENLWGLRKARVEFAPEWLVEFDANRCQ